MELAQNGLVDVATASLHGLDVELPNMLCRTRVTRQ